MVKQIRFNTERAFRIGKWEASIVLKQISVLLDKLWRPSKHSLIFISCSESKWPKWSNIINSFFHLIEKEVQHTNLSRNMYHAIKRVWITKCSNQKKRNHIDIIMIKVPHLHTVAGLLIHSPLDMNNSNFHPYYYNSENNIHWVHHIHWHLKMKKCKQIIPATLENSILKLLCN